MSLSPALLAPGSSGHYVTMAGGRKLARAGLWTPGDYEPHLAGLFTPYADVGIRRTRASLTVNSTDPFTPSNGAAYSGVLFTGKVTMPAITTGATFTDCYFAGANPTTSDGGQVDSRAGAGTSGARWDFLHCTFRPDNPNAWTDNSIGHHGRFTSCLLRDGVDGIGSYNTNGPDTQNEVYGCYIERLQWSYPDQTGDHADGRHCDVIQHQGGDLLWVIGNSLHGYVVDTTGNAPTQNISGSNSGPSPWLQSGQILQVQKATAVPSAPSNIKIQKNWIYGSFNGRHYVQVTDDIIDTDNKTMDNGLTKDGSHSNHIRISSAMSINGQTFTTGYYAVPSGWNDVWGFTGTDPFGTAVTAGDAVKIRVD